MVACVLRRSQHPRSYVDKTDRVVIVRLDLLLTPERLNCFELSLLSPESTRVEMLDWLGGLSLNERSKDLLTERSEAVSSFKFQVSQRTVYLTQNTFFEKRDAGRQPLRD